MIRHLAKVVSFVCLAMVLSLYASYAISEVIQYSYDDAGQLIRADYDTLTIIDYSYDALGNRLSKTTSLTQAFNNPPTPPVLLSPANATTEITPVDNQLEWTGGTDPDPGNKVFFDVYFGESPQPPLYKSSLTSNNIDLSAIPIHSLTTYYWQVVARDNLNAKSESEVWSFTTDNTIPSIPADLMPQDNSYVFPDDVYLTWSPSTDPDPYETVTYDIYFGNTATPPLVVSNTTKLFYHAGLLLPETTYYWQIVAKDTNGAVATSPVFSFTTLDPSHDVNGITLTEDTIFSGSHGPYIIQGNLTINEGVTLTIEPSAIIKLDASANIIVNGTLIAEGTSDNKIIFTSLKDDSYDGDANADGSFTIPSRGDWGRIQFNATSTDSSLANCTIQYGGSGNYGDIYINGSAPTITSSSIQKSSNHGVYIGSGSPMLQSLSIGDNGTLPGHYGIYITGGTPRITGTTIISTYESWVYVPADIVGSANLTGGTFVDENDTPGYITVLGGTISQDATWSALSVPYRTTGHIIVLGTDGTDGITTLTLEPGVIIESYQTAIIVGATSGSPGALIARGTEAEPITFTSSQNTPAPNDWRGISFYNTTDDATSILDHCIVEYGSYYYNYGNIYVLQSAPTIINTIVRKSGNTGIRVNGGMPVIKNTTIVDNLEYGIYFDSGSATITGNTISSTNSISILANDVGAANISENTFDVGGYVTVRGGTISQDATWSAISVPYRTTGHIIVLGTDGTDGITTLTLEPGVIIESYQTAIIVGATSGSPGALIARGTEAEPITFTSSQNTPAPNDWRGISFYNTTDDATSILDHCIVEYGSYYYNYGNIYVLQSAPTIINTIVRKSGNTGIRVNGGKPVIQNSTIVDNTEFGIYFDAGSGASITGNTISGVNSISMVANDVGAANISGNTFDTDGYVTVRGGTISQDATWSAISVPYRTTGHIIVLGTDGTDGITTLTLQPGVIIESYRTAIIIGATSGSPGALIARGTEAEPITFTSSQDTPAPNDWRGISFYNTTDDATSILDHCIVEYGSYYYNYGNIYVLQSAPTIINTIVRNSGNAGIRVNGGMPVIENTTIVDNLEYGIYFDSGSATMTGNTISSTNSISILANDVGAANISENTFDAGGYITVRAGTISNDATWSAISVPYRPNGNITVLGTDGTDGITTLTLEPGVIIESHIYAIIVGAASGDPGALVARGTEAEPITFTSSQDTPLPNDWRGLWFYNTTNDATTILDHCIVEYGSYYNNFGNIYALQSSPTITNTVIRKSGNAGIRVNAGSPIIQNSTIIENTDFGIYFDTGSATITGNTISGTNSISILANDVGAATISENTFDVGGYVTVRTGTISQDATWSAINAPYRPNGNITVLGTDGTDGITTLTLEPGVIIESHLYAIIVGAASGSPGALIARGTEADPVIFTSSQDTPLPNDWRGLWFYNTTDDTTTILDHCIVEYGSYYNNYGNIYALQSSPTITNTVVRKSGNAGIRVNAGSPIIQDSTIIENTDFGIYFDTGSATITGNTISGTNSISILANDVGAATISENTFDVGGYVTVRTGTISQDATWSAINAPYRPNGNITVLGTDGTDGITTLTLEPGVTIESHIYAIIVGAASGSPGALIARGTEADPVIFTSSQDTPLPNDWRGLWFYNTTDDTTTILDHCIVEYGSYYNNYGNIYALQSSPTIANTVVRKSGNAGIRVNAGSPIIQNSTIVANTTDGVYIDSGTPVINNNDIYANTGYGINNRATTTINAENNWWGHASGPLDNSDDTATGGLYNLTGTGSQVTDYVDYDPWTTDGPNIDTDNDGLSDYDEIYEYGTDPYNPDTDGDGLSDFDEIFTHGTDPNNPDSDGDGISDYDEVITYNTDPNNTDLDGDGLSDYDEINIYGTDPNNADTDGDGIRDDIEITLGTDPNNKLDKPALYNITLTTDTTFSNDVGPYVIQGALTVSEGVTLHIEPGTLLKFDTAATLVVNGTLDAPGIEGNEIIFTSLDNDAYGGDTNEDGSATTPAPGDWGGIWLNNTSGTSILDHCTIEYGGYNGSGIVNIAQASPQLFNSTVHLSSNDGIYINGGSAEIQYSTIVNNGTHGFYIDSGTPVINNNDIYANSGNGIYNTSVTMINAENNWWGDASGPYHVTSNSSATGDQVSDNVDYEPWITDGPNIDADGDGLTNYDELYLHETNPNNSDSDSDGLTDYEEVITYNTDPNSLDSDNDGFTDYEEIITYGTDPNVPN